MCFIMVGDSDSKLGSLATWQLCDFNSKPNLAADVASGADIFLAKRRHQDFAIGRPLVVVDDANDPVAALHAIGIGHVLAFIDHESAEPGFAIVV